MTIAFSSPDLNIDAGALFNHPMASFSATSIITIFATMIILYWIISPQQNDRESFLRWKVPFIGHLKESTRESNKAADAQVGKDNLLAQALRVPNGDHHAIYSSKPSAPTSLDRSLSSDPYIHGFTKHQSTASTEGLIIYESKPFYSSWLRTAYQAMTGQRMNLKARALESFAESLNSVPAGAGIEVDNP